jgi:hypothetical protein
MISLGALAAWVVIVHLEARRLALRDAERNAAVVAHAIAREQERLIDTAKQLLVGLSQRQEVLTANAGPCNVLFAGVVKGFSGYLERSSRAVPRWGGTASTAAVPRSRSRHPQWTAPVSCGP